MSERSADPSPSGRACLVDEDHRLDGRGGFPLFNLDQTGFRQALLDMSDGRTGDRLGEDFQGKFHIAVRKFRSAKFAWRSAVWPFRRLHRSRCISRGLA
jgi:hypothetical protein